MAIDVTKLNYVDKGLSSGGKNKSHTQVTDDDGVLYCITRYAPVSVKGLKEPSAKTTTRKGAKVVEDAPPTKEELQIAYNILKRMGAK